MAPNLNQQQPNQYFSILPICFLVLPYMYALPSLYLAIWSHLTDSHNGGLHLLDLCTWLPGKHLQSEIASLRKFIRHHWEKHAPSNILAEAWIIVQVATNPTSHLQAQDYADMPGCSKARCDTNCNTISKHRMTCPGITSNLPWTKSLWTATQELQHQRSEIPSSSPD